MALQPPQPRSRLNCIKILKKAIPESWGSGRLVGNEYFYHLFVSDAVRLGVCDKRFWRNRGGGVVGIMTLRIRLGYVNYLYIYMSPVSDLRISSRFVSYPTSI
ncbi:hypothetical protein TWF225_010067 [Orbilia oligospora]|uniref:Uncharacterized protein n=1 Tax=Orbilia oligospora TaxID=2813651 RepID=A0A7C8TRC5_ORBOL|nr:hypothetical protein TWF751_002372 [Orbilia oligospora]KAF3193304.1 hypothetical protein TWF225_010067 [Orbilia oligospora]KAF3243278.1 hypothetical protein TWF128_010257 [Orbilia oligospora]KAF3250883.1 hypothetical protein TWF217_008493 [Orbilia oligospora]TGJ67103.1 hypothetical protein EYR41_008681 [Orbilia oligospora]